MHVTINELITTIYKTPSVSHVCRIRSRRQREGADLKDGIIEGFATKTNTIGLQKHKL